jgi:hypothetical protein
VTPTLLFIHIGPELPPWLSPALQQARLFNSCAIVLVADAEALDGARLPASLGLSQIPLQELGVSDKQQRFRDISPLDRTFRGGFWTYTSERFFIVESVMAKLSLGPVVHLENDVLLYCSLDALAPRLSRVYDGIAATFDNDQRCVPGIVYFPGLRSAAALTDFLLAALQQLVTAPVRQGVNDMILLGAFRRFGRGAIDHLPIVPPDYPAQLRSAVGHIAGDPTCYSRNFDTLGYVFDAAALGQFLGGVDPRNGPGATIGFVNESCVFDPRVLRPRFVRDELGRRIPVVETASGIHAVANLHVHSKNPGPFLSS